MTNKFKAKENLLFPIGFATFWPRTGKWSNPLLRSEASSLKNFFATDPSSATEKVLRLDPAGTQDATKNAGF